MILDKKAAQRFLENPKKWMILLYCSEITEEAAELLVEKNRGDLDLSCLTKLGQRSAAILGAFNGSLYLDGLEEPSPDILEEFAERSWKPSQYLSLNGLRVIDEHQARALSSFNGKLGLRGITSISEKCAKIIGSGKAHHLYLDGIQSVSEKTLKHLLTGRQIVSLNSLRTLPEITGDWEDHQCTVSELYLNGLQSASSNSLKTIAAIPIDEFFLNGLEALPQDDEHLFENCGAAIFLNGLKKLTDIDLKILGTNRPSCSLILDGLEQLDERQAMELVGTDRGTLSLGLRKMSDEVASVLLRSKSYGFVMNRLEELTPFAAEICGRYICADNVYFEGIQQISDEAFELLLADYSNEEENWCPGSFSLTGIRHLTPRMRKALESTKHDVTLGEIF